MSERIVWPFALAFFDTVRILLSWCELRQGFRHFRTDRIADADLLDARYPKRRQALLKDWRRAEGITTRLLDAAGIWQLRRISRLRPQRQERPMTDPSNILLYVTDPEASARLYARLLGREPVEASPTFVLFALPSGLALSLWARNGVVPAPTQAGGGSEIGFRVDTGRTR